MDNKRIKVIAVMMIIIIIVCFIFQLFGFHTLILNAVKPDNSEPVSPNYSTVTNDSDKPLYLTPFIELGNIVAAQNASRVQPFVGNIQSYSGFLTVNKTYNSNLFFWFFPCNTTNWKNEKLVLWLQGGPGATSMYGLFVENGPYVFKHGILKERYYSWTTDFNLLYIDNPIGAGFSFTESELGYSRSGNDATNNLYEAIIQFYKLFPVLHKNDFIIAGESYAGKYIPSLANKIHNNNNKLPTDQKIKLFGLIIGNPMISAQYMLDYNKYFYYTGLLDKNGQRVFQEREEYIKLLIRSKQWVKAGKIFEETFFETHSDKETLFKNLTGINQHFHLFKTDPSENNNMYIQFLKRKDIRREIHTGNFMMSNGRKAYDYLQHEILQCSKWLIENLLPHYRILIYSGQFDIICPYCLVENVLYNLNWKHSTDYITADKKILKVDQYLAGYYTTTNTLTNVLIRNSGHMVPLDQPKYARVLIRRFANGFFDKNT